MRLQLGMSGEQKRITFQSIHELYAEEIPYYCLLYKTYGLRIGRFDQRN